MRSHSRSEAGSQRRIVLTFLDQMVSSVTNFTTGVAVARLSGAAQFGEYMLVLLIWIVIVGVHRRLVTEPMTVASGDADMQPAVIAGGLGAEIVLGIVGSVTVAAAGLVTIATGAHIGVTMLALSPWLVPLLIQDYWRATAFQRRRPDLALINDVAFAVVQVAGIVVFAMLGWRTPGYMIAAWGAGAVAGALLGFSWFPTVGRWREGWRLLCHLWPMSRWLLSDFVTAFASQQAYVAFAALILSKVEYGGFRAAASLMGPTIVILLAAGNIGLPEAARRVDSMDLTALRVFARRLTLGTMCCVAAYGLALAVAARPILRGLYGSDFARFAPLAVLAAVQYVVMVAAYGQGIALKATGAIRRLWRVRLVIAVASLTSLVLFVQWFGYLGAGWAGVATGAYDALAVYLIFRRDLGDQHDKEGPHRPLVVPSLGPSFSASPIPTDGAST